jgi:hypothetical protein
VKLQHDSLSFTEKLLVERFKKSCLHCGAFQKTNQLVVSFKTKKILFDDPNTIAKLE